MVTCAACVGLYKECHVLTAGQNAPRTLLQYAFGTHHSLMLSMQRCFAATASVSYVLEHSCLRTSELVSSLVRNHLNRGLLIVFGVLSRSMSIIVIFKWSINESDYTCSLK